MAAAVLLGVAALGSVTALVRDGDPARRGDATSAEFSPTPPPNPGDQAAGAAATGAEPTAAAEETVAPPAASAQAAVPAPASAGAPAAAPASRPSSIAEIADRPARTGSWPALTYTLRASPSAEEPLRFPGAIGGYRLAASSTTRVSLSENRYFRAVGGLPVRTASYDECRQSRFYVRWMTVDPSAVVQSTFVDQAVRTVQNRPVAGSSGWQSSYGCVQPAMRIEPGSAGPRQAVVIVETQVWRRR